MSQTVTHTGEMDAFVRAAMRQSFSLAARELSVTPSAVSKLVSRLENRLGVRLFNRTTRRLHLTPEGEMFLKRSRRILADIEEAESEILMVASKPRGLLRMHSTVAFAHYQLSASLRDFGARYPDIEVNLSVSDSMVDLISEGGDLAVRTGQLPDSTLIAKSIGSFEHVICASPEYLRHYGTPSRPQDLLEYNCLAFSGARDGRRWRFADPARTEAGGSDAVHEVEVKGRFSVNNADMLLQWAINGAGIVRLPDLMAGPAVRSGDLVALLTDFQIRENRPVWAVCPQGRQRSPRVQAMINFLVERYGDSPWKMSRND